ncbi:MAG: hypothetical protein AAF329_03625 [Cyanobacteria bacterium P01_A01_bin.17]
MDAKNISLEDTQKGVQEVPIVDSLAHFDLTEADVAAARVQGLEITSIRARSAHADDRLFDDCSGMSDARAISLMERLVAQWGRLKTADAERYQLEHEPGYGVTLKSAWGEMLYRYAGGLLVHNGLTVSDEAYLTGRLAQAEVISNVEAQRLVGQVMTHLENLPPDPEVPLQLEYEPGHSVVLRRSDGTVIFHEADQHVRINGFTELEVRSLTQRLVLISAQAPDPDPDVDR